MPSPSKRAVLRARERIQGIRAAVAGFELLCSGTLSQRMMKCGKPTCGCASDPAARHGPYYEWAHMRAGKPTRRYVSAQQAQVLRQAIDNYKRVKKLLREWEDNTERLIDGVQPAHP
jgi:hypothetical protein